MEDLLNDRDLWLLTQKYNLKSIHNWSEYKQHYYKLVIAHTKIQFEINSQLLLGMSSPLGSCDCSHKNTIWNQFTTRFQCVYIWIHLWLLTQKYNLKSIHNATRLLMLIYLLVIAHTKIQFEINSQPLVDANVSVSTCDCSHKNTIWNQFTTNSWQFNVQLALWLLTQKYNLKSIHNKNLMNKQPNHLVIAHTKIQFEINSQRKLNRS